MKKLSTVLLAIILAFTSTTLISCGSQEAKIIHAIKKTELFRLYNEYPYFKRNWDFTFHKEEGFVDVQFDGFVNYRKETDVRTGRNRLVPTASISIRFIYYIDCDVMFVQNWNLSSPNVVFPSSDFVTEAVWNKIVSRERISDDFWRLLEIGYSYTPRNTVRQRRDRFEDQLMVALGD